MNLFYGPINEMTIYVNSYSWVLREEFIIYSINIRKKLFQRNIPTMNLLVIIWNFVLEHDFSFEYYNT